MKPHGFRRTQSMVRVTHCKTGFLGIVRCGLALCLPAFMRWCWQIAGKYLEYYITPIGKLFKIFGVKEKNQHIWAFAWTNSNGKTQFWKHFIQPLLRSWVQVPQMSPMGPKFLVQNFSHIICIRWVLIGIFDLFTKNQSLFSDPDLFVLINSYVGKSETGFTK